MPRYRIDFLFAESDQVAKHEIHYESDRAAIIGAHAINGFPTIGFGFRIWRAGCLIYRHANEPQFIAASRDPSSAWQLHHRQN